MQHLVAPVQKVKKQLRSFPSSSSFIISSATVFLICFMLSFVSTSLIIQPQPSKAITGLNLVSSPTITLTSNSNINLELTPTTAGALASASHNLTASTNVPTGYNLTLGTAAAPSLPTTTGTINAPTTLANNTWGYALARSGATGAIGTTNGFDASYTTLTPSTTSKWANPSTTATIKNTSASTTSDSTTVYYGIRANTTLAAGTYDSTVRYTATANTANIPTPTITSITPNVGPTTGLTAVQIVGTGFTVNDQSVTTAVTIGGAVCTNVTISSNTPSTGRDTIYCTNAARATAGAVNVAVTTWKSTVTLTNGYTYAAPTANITAPTASQILNAGTTSTTLTVTTNYTAICYYGTATNPTTQMTNTASTTHSQTITGLANNTTNTRYVRCQAAAGHTYGSNTSVTFYVKAATPAAPTLSPANGSTVINGTTTITVTSAGATCTWGTVSGIYPNASGTTKMTATGTNTLYYNCVAGSGDTLSDARTGSWSYTGQVPMAQTGDHIQTVTTANCPTTRTRVNDARDNASYWVQKMPDNRCWMLTNLAYAGGGTNTYGDVKTLYSGSGYYGGPYYFKPLWGSNETFGTTDPSTSTDGGATNPQYGLLYDGYAVLDTLVCPAGWRLPTGSPSGELQVLTNAIGVTSNTAGSTKLKSTWLAMYSGWWYSHYGEFREQGSSGVYWSSTPHEPPVADQLIYTLGLNDSYVGASQYLSSYRDSAYAVRCIAI